MLLNINNNNSSTNTTLLNLNNQHKLNKNDTESNNSDDAETKKMLSELRALKSKNQMYLDKIQKLDTMSEKLKTKKSDDVLINKE